VRTAVLVAALVLTSLLAFGTLFVLLTSGPDVLVVISFLVLALFFFGIFGALSTPPDDR
jgi:hypothetical protein